MILRPANTGRGGTNPAYNRLSPRLAPAGVSLRNVEVTEPGVRLEKEEVETSTTLLTVAVFAEVMPG